MLLPWLPRPPPYSSAPASSSFLPHCHRVARKPVSYWGLQLSEAEAREERSGVRRALPSPISPETPPEAPPASMTPSQWPDTTSSVAPSRSHELPSPPPWLAPLTPMLLLGPFPPLSGFLQQLWLPSPTHLHTGMHHQRGLSRNPNSILPRPQTQPKAQTPPPVDTLPRPDLLSFKPRLLPRHPATLQPH